VQTATRPSMRPLVRASLLSCAAMASGDALQQGLAARKARRPLVLDTPRLARFAAVGACLHGPWFFAGFRALDARFPGKSLVAVLSKTAAGQVTLFPAYLAAALFALAMLEGLELDAATARVRAAFPRAFTAGCVFWPCANVLNFALIPPGMPRVAYVNSASIAWNAYLSLVAADAAAVKK